MIASLHVEELLLRVPGLGREEARRLGEDVAARVARALGVLRPYRVPSSMALRIRVPEGLPTSLLAEAIARQIVEALQ